MKKEILLKVIGALQDCAHGGRCHEFDNVGTPCGLCTDRAEEVLEILEAELKSLEELPPCGHEECKEVTEGG